MSIKVQIPTPMREQTGGLAVVEGVGNSVQELLDNVGKKYPAFVGRIFDNGKLRPFINIYVNDGSGDEDIRYLDNLKTSLKDGTEVSIIPAVSGG
jgi:sulfur-carrier protein